MPNWLKSLPKPAAFLAFALLLLAAGAPAFAAGDRYDFAYAWSVADADGRPGNPGQAVEAGDFDGDGRADLATVVLTWTDVRLVFLFQQADGQRPVPQSWVLSTLAPGQQVVGMATGDLDQDGRAEVLLSTTQGLIVARIGAGRTFATTVFLADRREALSPPVAVDVDRDGHLDVVQAEQSIDGSGPSEIAIRYGDGTGALPRSRLVPTGENRYTRFETGDVNGDGFVDLVALLPQYALAMPVAILRGNGAGGFAGPDTSVSGRNYTDVAVFDVTGDGRDDVVMINPSLGEFFGSGLLTEGHVFAQGADGQLAGPQRLALPGAARSHDFIDLDGNGQRDLANLSARGEARIGMRLARGGDFEALREFAVSDSPNSFGAMSDFNRDSAAYGDFNGDGITDVAVAGFDNRIVLVAGRLTPWATNASPPGAPLGVTAAVDARSTTVMVQYQPPASDGGSPITRYEVIAEPSAAVLDSLAQNDPLSLSRRMYGQANGASYRYFVRAYNAAGPGPLSAASNLVQVLQLPSITGGVAQVVEPESGTRVLRFQLSLSRPALPGGVTFDARTANVTAQAGLDYEPIALTGVRIPEGGQSATVDVIVLSDDLVESLEIFHLEVSNAVGTSNPAITLGGVINDSDGVDPMPLPLLWIHDAAVVEGNTGTTVLRFPIELSSASTADVRFNAATSDGDALAGSDYASVSREVVIPAGQVSAWLDVPVTPDVEDEYTERFQLEYSGAVGAAISQGFATGMIVDDDTDRGGVPAPVLADAEKGFVDVDLTSLEAETGLFGGTAMMVPSVRQAAIRTDPTPADPFDALANGVAWTTVLVPANTTASAVEVRVLAVAKSPTARAVSLFAGPGSTPGAGAVACARTDAEPEQFCELVVRREPGAPEARYWALVQNVIPGPSTTDSVELELGAVTMVPVNRELVASSQAVLSGGDFRARLGWDIPGLAPGERRLGYLIVESTPGVALQNRPLRLHRTGAIDAPHVLAPGERRDVRLAPGDAQERIVFDVPVNAQSVTFTLEGQGEVSLFAAHSAQPSSPLIAAAPARALADAVSSLPGAAQSITLSGAQLRKGRWHLTPANRGATPASVTLRASVVAQGARPAFRPGHYFNPARPGHGLFLDFAGDQWLMVWYTYLQDGTSTWYYTQGPAPAADQAQWPVDLLRVSRGATTRAVRVGSATLTVLEGPAGASPKLAFGYNLDGDAGWETLTRLGDDQCPTMGGQPLDGSGHWYAPQAPGHGFSAQILPNTEVYAAYIYDSAGFPRWLIGQKDYQPSVTAVTMQQLTGFCPTCPLVPLQSRSVGVMTRTLGMSAFEGGRPAVTSITLDALLEQYAWSKFTSYEPVYRLSARKGCD